MIHEDTIKLLRECDAGIKMGVSAIDEVRGYVKSGAMQRALTDCKRQHEQLKDELQQALCRFGDDGKNPNPIAKSMSQIKTNLKLGMDMSDATVADLMTDGCNMGVKSLSKYLNEYKVADESAKDLAKKLIAAEALLSEQMRQYL